MKLFLLVTALVASASAAAVKPAEKSQIQVLEYFKPPEPSQVRAAVAKQKREDDVLAAVEYFKAPESSQVRAAAPRDKREVDVIAAIGFNPPKKNARRPRRAVAQSVEPIVTYMPARTIVPMATYTAAAKTVEEKEQMRKNVAAWREYKDEMHNALHYCQVRQNVSVAVSDKLMNLEMENVSRKEHCYVYCVLERLGKYNPAGVQMDKMRQSVGPFVGMERLNKILDKCHAVTAPSVCESGYKFFECYRQTMFDMREAEDKPAPTYVWMVQQ